MDKQFLKIRGFLSFFDSLGAPIQLNYKGDKTYKASFGGLLSIFLAFIVLLFSLDKIKSNDGGGEFRILNS